MASTAFYQVHHLVLLLVTPVCLGVSIQPGVFNPLACTDDITSSHLKAFCDCKQKHNVTTFQDMCRVSPSDGLPVYQVLGKCVEGGALPGSFLGQSFSRKQLNRSFEYLCKVYGGMATDLNTCWDRNTALVKKCEEWFRKDFNSTADQFSQKSACNMSHNLRLCYFNGLDCPPRDRHFISKLSESYLSNKCTQHFEESVSMKCNILSGQIYDQEDAANMSVCLARVETMRECFTFESIESTHPFDQINFNGIDISRYVTFARLECKLATKTCVYDDKAAHEHAKCEDLHFGALDNQVSRAEMNVSVSVHDLCSVFSKTFQCFNNITSLSTECRQIVQAFLCAHSPGACPCPLTVSRASPTALTSFWLQVAVLLTIYLCH